MPCYDCCECAAPPLGEAERRNGSHERLSVMAQVTMPQYTWPVGLGILFLVAWGAFFVVGVFQGAAASTAVLACHWDNNVNQCSLSALALQRFIEKSRNPEKKPWLDFSICMQQQTEDSCVSHGVCSWDSEQTYCQSKEYINCLLAAVRTPALGTEVYVANSTEPDPDCGTVGDYAKAVYMCEQLSTKGQCNSNRKCKWNTQEWPCVVNDEFFVDLVFGDMEKVLKASVLAAGVSCREQEDKDSCVTVTTTVAGEAKIGSIAVGNGAYATALKSPRLWIFT